MAMAFRPRPSPCSISSRYGSQSLADRSGWSTGGLWLPEGDAPRSVVTSLAGFAGSGGSGSVVTSLAGFAGDRLPHAPGGRTAIPAAFR